MLEVAYKIAANILKSRLIPIQESLDHEAQCGFRPGRGCADGIFTVKTALRKRREHGLETWVMFLDLVKAFERVPRELLWKILEKFEVPEKIIFLPGSLHQNVCVKFSVCSIEHSMKSIIGVKQGDIHLSWTSAIHIPHSSHNEYLAKGECGPSMRLQNQR